MTFFPGQVELDRNNASYEEGLARVRRYLKPGWEAIYVLTAEGDDRVYLGRSANPHRRFSGHESQSVSGLVDRWKQSLADRGLKLKMVVLACTPSHNVEDVEDCFIETFKQAYGDNCLNTLRGTAPLSVAQRNAMGEAISRAMLGKYSRHDLSTQQIVQLYEAGNSCRVIARILRTGHSTVLHRLKGAGIAIRSASVALKGKPRPHVAGSKSPSFRHDISTTQIVQLYEAGHGSVDIARILGTGSTTVLDRLSEAGILRRPTRHMHSEGAKRKIGAARTGSKHPLFRHDVPTPQIVQLYEAGHSQYYIATTLGISQSIVSHRLRNAGVSIRHKSTSRYQRKAA